MKKQRIYMKAWLDFHLRDVVVSTDSWYLDLANELLLLARESQCHDTEHDCQQMALMLALYMEDCIADGGNWRQFIHWHKKNYGRYLPFYSLSDDYLWDEINKEDIAFLIWASDRDSSEWVNTPLAEDAMEFADAVYRKLDSVFEEAPISEDLAEDWLMETELMEKERTPLPVASLDEKLPTNVERFLKASRGESLMYFDSYDALRIFFLTALEWDDEDDSLLENLDVFENFVLYANPKGLLIGMDVAEYFADERNKLYNAELAKEEAWELFCEQGICPFDLLKYGMEHNLLSEAQFPFEDGKRLLHENWDFLARWFLGEYYEGE